MTVLIFVIQALIHYVLFVQHFWFRLLFVMFCLFGTCDSGSYSLCFVCSELVIQALIHYVLFVQHLWFRLLFIMFCLLGTCDSGSYSFCFAMHANKYSWLPFFIFYGSWPFLKYLINLVIIKENIIRELKIEYFR